MKDIILSKVTFFLVIVTSFLAGCCAATSILAVLGGSSVMESEAAQQKTEAVKVAAIPKPTLTLTSSPTVVPTLTSTFTPAPTSTQTPSLTPTAPIPTRTFTMTPTLEPTVTPVDIEKLKATWGTVDIRDLIKNPEKYMGQRVHYKGEVFRISEDADGTMMQVWIDTPGNISEREAVVVFYRIESTSGIYEKTPIEFWGVSTGAYEGKNAFGATIRQPLIEAIYLAY
jgi:hypothetical protein